MKKKISSSEKPDHWLDLAKTKYTPQLVEDVKIALRVLVIFIPLPVFWALFDQQGSRWTFQATRMNGQIGSYIIKPDQMQLFSRAGILRNSREKGIYQLDLKILSAFCICFRSLTRLFQIPMCDTIRDVDQSTMSGDLRFATDTIPDDMIKELVYWCIKISGKEEVFFTPFKLKMHELFSTNNKH